MSVDLNMDVEREYGQESSDTRREGRHKRKLSELEKNITTVDVERLIKLIRKEADLVRVLGQDLTDRAIARGEYKNVNRKTLSEIKKAIINYYEKTLQPPEKLDMARKLRFNRLVKDLHAEWVEKYTAEPTALELERRKLKSELMKTAKRQFTGCIAANTPKETYDFCFENDRYKDPEKNYEQYSIVPRNRLQKAEYDYAIAHNGEEHPHAKALALGARAHISQLPKGVAEYADRHGEEYEDYLSFRKSEVNFLEAIKRNKQNKKYSELSNMYERFSK